MNHASCQGCGSFYIVEHVCRQCGRLNEAFGYTRAQQQRGLAALTDEVRPRRRMDATTRVLFLVMVVLACVAAIALLVRFVAVAG